MSNIPLPSSTHSPGLPGRIAGWILAFQPVFAVPTYILVLAGSQFLWLSLAFAFFPLVLRLWLTRRLFVRTSFDIPILIFVLGTLIGLLVSPDKNVAVGALASTFASIVVYYGMVSNVQRGDRYWLCVGAVISAISLLLGIWFFSQGTARYEPFNRWFFKIFEALPKTEGPVLQFNSLGALLAVAIPVACGLAIFCKRPVLRWAALSLGLIFLAMLFLSASGGGWIAVLCGLAALLVFWRKRTVFAVIPAAGITAALAAFFYGKAVWLQHVFSTVSLFDRFALWKNTISLLTGQSAIVGLGLGGWTASYNSRFGEVRTHVHNSYLQLYADSGLPGIVACVLAFVVVVRLGAGILSSSPRQAWYGVGVGMMAAIVAGGVMAMYEVTTTVTVIGTASYVYLSIPMLWVWAALFVVSQKRITSGAANALRDHVYPEMQ